MGLSLEAAQVNPKCFVFGHKRMHVHGRFNSNAANGSANGFGMVHRQLKSVAQSLLVQKGNL
jgi:hypothetical protein